MAVRVVAVGFDRPRGHAVTVEGGRPADRALAGEEALPVVGRHEPRAVGMREEHVVVFGEVARRSRRVGIGAWCVGRVEQFPAVFVVERPQPRCEPVDDFAQRREAAPCGDVGDRRGPERGEVAEDEVVDRRPRRDGSTEERFGGGRPDLAGATPDSAWRHLDEGQVVAACVRERTGVQVGESFRHRVAELAAA